MMKYIIWLIELIKKRKQQLYWKCKFRNRGIKIIPFPKEKRRNK